MSDTIDYEELGITPKHEVLCSVCSKGVGNEPIEHVILDSKMFILHMSCLRKIVSEWSSEVVK